MPVPDLDAGRPGDEGERELRDPQAAFAELGSIILGAQPLTQVLQRVAELAKETVPGSSEVSVTLVRGGRPSTVVFTGSLAPVLDERQYESGFGPCLDAAITGDMISISDTATSTIYADFSALAARHGVRASVSVGMPILQRTIGAINVYSATEFDEQALALAQAFAAYAAVALANAELYQSTVELAGQMRDAMASRASIEQAKGMLMAIHQCSADEAFARLSLMSNHQNRKLRDIAAEIVQRYGGSDDSRRRGRRADSVTDPPPT